MVGAHGAEAGAFPGVWASFSTFLALRSARGEKKRRRPREPQTSSENDKNNNDDKKRTRAMLSSLSDPGFGTVFSTPPIRWDDEDTNSAWIQDQRICAGEEEPGRENGEQIWSLE